MANAPQERESRVGYLTSVPDGINVPRKLFEDRIPRQDFWSLVVVSPPWLGAAERAKGVVDNAINGGHLADRDYLITGTTVMAVEGSGPLIPRAFSFSTKEIHQALSALSLVLLGREGKGILQAQLLSGVAVYDCHQRKGLSAERRLSFTFAAFTSRQEVLDYLKFLSRVTYLEAKINEKLKANHYLLPQNFLTKWGKGVRDRAYFANPANFQTWTRDEEEELKIGWGISFLYPGGLYLGALVAMGKVISLDGRPIAALTDQELAAYLLLARDANSSDAQRLADALSDQTTPFEVIYQTDRWTRVYVEARRPAYPLYQFYLTERERLTKSPKEIWQDPALPLKVKRQLLLQKLGLEINPHLHVSL